MGILQIETIYNVGFGSVTICLVDLPLYGEGRNIDEAVDDLINAVIEFIDIYQEKIEIYRIQFTDSQLKEMGLILECCSEREQIKSLIPMSYTSIR